MTNKLRCKMDYEKIKLPVKNITFLPRKNATYVYYTTEKKYLKDKGFNQNKRVCIGKLDTKNNDYFYPNEMYIQHFGMQNISLKENENKFSRTLSFGTKMVVEKVFEKLNLNQILAKVFPDKANLIKSLVCYYLENQNSAIQLYEKWARRNALFTVNIDSNSTFSRLFNDIITSSKTNEFLYFWNQEFSKNSLNKDIIMSLDTTNFNTYSASVPLAEYGKPKVDEGLKQINLAYIINNETSIPLYYQLFPGSVIDQSQCKELVTKAKEFNYKKITLVMDRGFYSANNINFLLKNQYKYIIMAKSRNKVLNDLLESVREKIKNKSEYYLEEFMNFGIKLKAKAIGQQEQHIYIYYNDEIAQAKRKAFNLKVKKFKEQAINSNLDLETVQNMYKTHLDVFVDENNKRNARIKKEVQQEEYDNAGFVVLVSNIDADLEFILRQYKKRDIVEKAFATLKSTLDFNKFYSASGETIEAKVFVSFLAIIVRAHISFKLKPFLEMNTFHTVNTIITEFTKLEVTKINKTYVQSYALTRTQKIIFEYLEISEKDLNNSIKIINKMLS